MKLPNNILFNEVENAIRNGETVKLKLVGNSMYPILRDCRDTIILEPFNKCDLRCGAVALFKYRDTYILHRIISIENNVYNFCGDANIGLTEVVHLDAIVALMVGVEFQSGRKLSCNSSLWRFYSYSWIKLYPFRRYLLHICKFFVL